MDGNIFNPFSIIRRVLQCDPILPYLFLMQVIPIASMMESLRNTHGVPLSPTVTAPPATFYADDTTVIARSPTHAVNPYNIAVTFCKVSRAKLHPDKWVTISTSPSKPILSNGTLRLQPSECATILFLPFGPNITREQQIHKFINKLIHCCTSWAHVSRTLEGRAVITQAIILSTMWYVLSTILISTSGAKKSSG